MLVTREEDAGPLERYMLVPREVDVDNSKKLIFQVLESILSKKVLTSSSASSKLASIPNNLMYTQNNVSIQKQNYAASHGHVMKYQ